MGPQVPGSGLEEALASDVKALGLNEMHADVYNKLGIA